MAWVDGRHPRRRHPEIDNAVRRVVRWRFPRLRQVGRGWASGFLFVAGFGLSAADRPVPVSVQAKPGRFEISALDASAAHALVSASEEAWRMLAGPLGLPDAFSSPIFVRVSPWTEGEVEDPFHVLVEPGGIVSLRVMTGPAVSRASRRAVVRALLLRRAVARFGVSERLNAPLWLEHAGVGWWETQLDAARLDGLKYESPAAAPPALEALLGWAPGEEEPRVMVAASVWLLMFLQSESGRGKEWASFLDRLLGGEEPLGALVACYPGRFVDVAERELWWQTGYHHFRLMRSLPTLEADESRRNLAELARFVFAGPTEAMDAVVPFRRVLDNSHEPLVLAEIGRRRLQLERLIPRLHPFYRNAGLALDAALREGVKLPLRRGALLAAFEQDWRDGAELEESMNTALDGARRREDGK